MITVLQRSFARSKANITALKRSKRFARTALSIALCSLPALSFAQTPVKAGNEFLVNAYTALSQRSSSVNQLSDGQFFVTYVTYNEAGEGNVYLRRFTASGTPIDTEYRAHEGYTGNRHSPGATTLNDGSFIITWVKQTDSPKSHTLRAQRFDRNGRLMGGEITLYSNNSESANLGINSITPVNNGGFALSWTEHDYNIPSYATVSQVFDTSGTALSPKMKVGYSGADITELANGGFVIVASDGSNNIDARRYSANGTKIGNKYFINDENGTTHTSPAISRLSNGEIIVTWSNNGIYARRLDINGLIAGAPFKVSTFSGGNQTAPAISAGENGSYVVTWQSRNQDGSGTGIYAQAFNSDDSPNGEEFLVNTNTEYEQRNPSIKHTNANEFVISWAGSSATGDYNVYAQKFEHTIATAPTNTMTLSLPQTTVLEGDTVTLPLTVSGAGIYGLDAIVSLNNTSKARVSGGEYGEFLPSDERLSVPMGINNNQWDGALALMAPATAKSGEGEFAAVTLITEQPGTVNLTLQAQMTDQQGNYLLQGNTNYAFTIEESVTLTGNIASLGISGDFAHITLYINGQLVTINPDGSFSVRVGLGEVTMTLSAPGYLTAEKRVDLTSGQADIDFGQINLIGGDSNNDNRIDIADLTLLLGAYRSVEGEQNGYVMAADFNRDGAINLQDLTLLGANFGKQGPQSW
ncbi:dockerin type I domain-containing protein [Pseudoalteromonas sp. OOF1S-7]|uniref:dockerin type I domain-containing protein n=1 Tax=Pseudoalteromonas sp. OOF1S-7 TaxID=2917757 RepID=UPI001EF52960|nr:dockerin type I domain-containing protein [Pseudoalteromonas sp. OOF1S-7]MCG7534626.1 hypothetical protein [Pseudoalteromonas sp. OOF1S-7]